MWLSSSLIGAYIVQTFFHSLIAILVIERALQIWEIRNPLTQFRYRIMALVLPVVMLPLYQLVNLGRGSLSFREDVAVLNINRWLSIEIWAVLPVSAIFVACFVVTSIIFFCQEILPIVRDLFPRRQEGAADFLPADEEVEAMTADLCGSLGIEKPPVRVLVEDEPVIFASGSKSHAIVMSSGLIDMLDREQLRSAIAHELAHIVRRSNATTWLVFLFRILMFFNPIVLVVFRRIVQDDEHVCDDITVSLTGKPLVLAAVLRIFSSGHGEGGRGLAGGLVALRDGIEDHSHDLLLKERIGRLEEGAPYEDRDFVWGRFALTMLTIVVLNYHVV